MKVIDSIIKALQIAGLFLALLFVNCNSDRNRAAPGANEDFNAVTGNSDNKNVASELKQRCYWLLPIKSDLKFFNVGIRTKDYAESSKLSQPFFELLELGDSFAVGNEVIAPNPFGCIFMDRHNAIIGLSLIPAFEVDERNISLGPVGDWAHNECWFGYHSNNLFYTPKSVQECSAIKVRSIDALSKMKIEYIDFGVSGFGDGIWDSLAKNTGQIGLKGLVIVRSKEMLESRRGAMVPGIKGLVLHAESIGDVQEYGQAFPDVRLLILCIPDGAMISDIMKQSVIAKNYPNLRCLKILPSILPVGGQYPENNQPLMTFRREMLPPSLISIYLDGMLLSRENMVRYDRFGGSNDSKEDGSNLSLDVVFMSYGYTSGGARSVRKHEYAEAESFWRH